MGAVIVDTLDDTRRAIGRLLLDRDRLLAEARRIRRELAALDREHRRLLAVAEKQRAALDGEPRPAA